VRAFGGRFVLDDHGNALPIDPDALPAGTGATGVPAVFYDE